MIKVDNKSHILKVAMAMYFIVIVSCNSSPSNEKAPNGSYMLAYSYKNFKQRDSACGNNPDSTCTIVKIVYPDFEGEQALNDSIAKKFNALFTLNGSKQGDNYDQLAANFLNYYHSYKKGQPKSTLIYLLDGKAKVINQDSALLAVEVTGYSYHGGPHGVEYTAYVNWNTKTNKSIELKDILVKGYRDSLNKIAEQIFRKDEKLSDTSSLNNQRTYFFKDNKFSLPNNWLLTRSGIRFLYNVYTIKAYAAGPTKLFIPYTQIQSLLLPGTVLKQYLDKE